MQALRAFRARWAVFRDARRAFVEQRPLLKWTLVTVSWLPLGLFITDYVVNIKTVRGRSMQVRP